MSVTLRLPEKARQRLETLKVALPPVQAPEKPVAAQEVAPTGIPDARRRTIAELHEILAAAHPALFDKEAPVPLAVGIFKRLRGTVDMSATELRRALAVWCNRDAYLLALRTGVVRLDIDGTETPITPEQVAFLQKGKK